MTGMPHKGVIFSSGHNWKEQRTVSLAILRMFGMGKNILAEKIQEEVNCLMNYLSSHTEKPVNFGLMTNISTCNIICSIIIGHRFQYDEPEIQNIVSHLEETLSTQKTVSVINFIPGLKIIPGDLFKAKKTISTVNSVLVLISKFLDVKKQEDVGNLDADSFIAAYMIEQHKKTEAGESTYMDDENLIKIIFDLFIAGTDTTSTTISWCILYFLNYPDVQEKVYQEIADVIGTERTPAMHDKPKLPYLNAVIIEVQRLASIVPLSLAHMCPEEVMLRGYVLPKETFIVPNLDSVLHDKKIWGADAMSFRPERFLDDEGKIRNPEEFIPFGLGRRACLGEAMAKMELFLFFSSLFQRFKFMPVNPASPPSMEPNFGIITSPQPYEVRILERIPA